MEFNKTIRHSVVGAAMLAAASLPFAANAQSGYGDIEAENLTLNQNQTIEGDEFTNHGGQGGQGGNGYGGAGGEASSDQKQQQSLSNNIDGDSHKYRAFAFTATNGVTAAVQAAAGQCNEINNDGFAVNLGAILGAIGFADSDGVHEIADERCQVVVTALQKILIDDQQQHEMEYLDKVHGHEVLMLALDHYFNYMKDDHNHDSESSIIEHAAATLTAAAASDKFRIGVATAVLSKQQLIAAGKKASSLKPEDIYSEGLKQLEKNESLLDKQIDIEAAKVAARALKLQETKQVFNIPVVNLSNGETMTIGDAEGDRKRWAMEAEGSVEENRGAPVNTEVNEVTYGPYND